MKYLLKKGNNLKRNSRQSGFTLIELIITLVIIGIVMVFVAPKYANMSTNAKEQTLKGTLGIVRSAVNAKYLENLANGTNQYPATITTALFADQMIPKNPINRLSTTKVTTNSPITGADLDNSTGWVYNATTGELRANQSGNDSGGTPYLSY